MTKLTAIVVEDEFKLREVFIQQLKRNCPAIEVIAEAGNITDAYALINSNKPDVVFLDIEMPKGSGFDLLSKFDKIPFEIVFVTSYEHYAIRALRLSALDYILKPLMVEDLAPLPERIRNAIELKESAVKYNLLQSNLKSSEEEKKIVLQTRTKTEFVNLNKIAYLQAELNYTSIFLVDQTRIVVAKTLKEFEEMLCEDQGYFIRVHKKYIININQIRSIERGEECSVYLKDDTKLEVSRRRKGELLDRFNAI
ncbi:MAG TPA: LytTR family DNA-binding domain-containing protein [Bacteroidia bacterium]|jgi:two-component system LytT family response regulator|nr:LytTR family DNA-binding domain-containing protein [Bacteroidia bacterium]